MDVRELLNILTVAERLKDTTRHCYTSQGRQESVADHTWMMSLIALLLMDEFEEVDMNKVIRMCIIHDLGECFTQDIPAFAKNQDHRDKEEQLLNQWLGRIYTLIFHSCIVLFVHILSVLVEEIGPIGFNDICS
ncbi:HD domain-containing protein [Ignavigranum ruoffiae]|uniref:HD domain-containing protein n=1 Tax=Ignavigranum ruoffiae TaxID=89093 RepID=UPI0024AE5C29|nr:HD domain-containing protein [Ignavigranum ruoffiae]